PYRHAVCRWATDRTEPARGARRRPFPGPRSRLSFADYGIGEASDSLDGDRNGVAVLDGADARGGPGEDDVTGQQGHDRRDPFHDGADVVDHQGGAAVLFALPFDLGAQFEVGRVNFGDDPRPDGTEAVMPFGPGPLAVG